MIGHDIDVDVFETFYRDTDEDEPTGRIVHTLQDRPLYHWSPMARRGQIERYGLRPSMRPTLSVGWSAPYVCFADSPTWAWALSGGMSHAPVGIWDLWETYLGDLPAGAVEILTSVTRGSGLHEVRVTRRVFKRTLRYVGSRAS